MGETAVAAVHDDDLDQLLEGLELLEDFRAGRIACAFCGDRVNYENLYALFPDGQDIKSSCDKPACIRELKRERYNR